MREIGRRKRKVVAVSVDVGPSLPLPVLEQHDRRIALDVERREQRRLLRRDANRRGGVRRRGGGGAGRARAC
eukprot:486758-Pleurochrysis_carterae.AAC.1